MNTERLRDKKDSPRVYVPPPLIYVAVFFMSVYLQRKIPMDDHLFHSPITAFFGAAFTIVALAFIFPSLRQFFLSKNTLITIRPASSLQTTGIYQITRNPMYIGLASIYLAVTCFIGNWWNVILFPLLILIVQQYIITREEKYLIRRFGQQYLIYKSTVRRWF